MMKAHTYTQHQDLRTRHIYAGCLHELVGYWVQECTEDGCQLELQYRDKARVRLLIWLLHCVAVAVRKVGACGQGVCRLGLRLTLRARNPSSQSVADAAENTMVQQKAEDGMSANHSTPRTGTSSSLMNVRTLGRVTSGCLGGLCDLLVCLAVCL